MDTYEIRMLTPKHAQEGSHAALRRALAQTTPTEAIIEVWCGGKCVYAGNLAKIRFAE